MKACIIAKAIVKERESCEYYIDLNSLFALSLLKGPVARKTLLAVHSDSDFEPPFKQPEHLIKYHTRTSTSVYGAVFDATFPEC